MNTLALKHFRAVIFDMDGLLLDSERIAYAIGRDLSAELGLPWRAEVAHSLIGRNARDVAQLLREAYGADFPLEVHAAAFQQRYRAVIESGGVPLKPGVRELLGHLQAHRIPCAVATSTPRERARLKLMHSGLLGDFAHVVAGDEVRHGKPAPDIFLAAAAALAVDPSACLALEDSNAGARAALAAGMRVVMVPDMLPPQAELIAAGAQVCASLHLLREWLT